MITNGVLRKSHGRMVKFKTDLDGLDGIKFYVDGFVYVENRNVFFLHNNNMAAGGTPHNDDWKKLGYSHSWCIARPNNSDDTESDDILEVEFKNDVVKTVSKIIKNEPESIATKKVKDRIFYYSRTYQSLVKQLPKMRVVVKLDMKTKKLELLLNGEDALDSNIFRKEKGQYNILKLQNDLAVEIGLDFTCYKAHFGVSDAWYDIDNAGEAVKLIDGKSKKPIDTDDPPEEYREAMRNAVEDADKHYAEQDLEKEKQKSKGEGERADNEEQKAKDFEKSFNESQKALKEEQGKNDDVWKQVIASMGKNKDEATEQLKGMVKGQKGADDYASSLSGGELKNRIENIKQLMETLEKAEELENFAKSEKLQIKIFKAIVEKENAFNLFSTKVNKVIFKQ